MSICELKDTPCCISKELCEEPVLASDGYVYDLKLLKRLISSLTTFPPQSPITHEILRPAVISILGKQPIVSIYTIPDKPWDSTFLFKSIKKVDSMESDNYIVSFLKSHFRHSTVTLTISNNFKRIPLVATVEPLGHAAIDTFKIFEIPESIWAKGRDATFLTAACAAFSCWISDSSNSYSLEILLAQICRIAIVM